MLLIKLNNSIKGLTEKAMFSDNLEIKVIYHLTRIFYF